MSEEKKMTTYRNPDDIALEAHERRERFLALIFQDDSRIAISESREIWALEHGFGVDTSHENTVLLAAEYLSDSTLWMRVNGWIYSPELRSESNYAAPAILTDSGIFHSSGYYLGTDRSLLAEERAAEVVRFNRQLEAYWKATGASQ